MKIEFFYNKIKSLKIDFFTGVPDSQLRSLGDFLMKRYGVGEKHIIAANEGAAVGLAAGHFLATQTPALVYMQNSGIGNAINPICSLLNSKVYEIPALFVIGWRGEPGIKDEPQHVFQGEITPKLLECVGIQSFIIMKDTTEDEFDVIIKNCKDILNHGKQVAFVIGKDALQNEDKQLYSNQYEMSREEIVNLFLDYMNEEDIIVSTTGKLSRELFEAREQRGQEHKYDFLTVGSMGHASMIALGIALEKKDRRVFCMDGDGALLMHMGSMPVLASEGPENMIHVVINNEAHETVGGMPTVSSNIDLVSIAKACGYVTTVSVDQKQELTRYLKELSTLTGPVFIEIKANLQSRKNLGRPTTSPIENKLEFMKNVQNGGNTL